MKYTITASFLAPVLDLKEKAPLNLYGPYYVSTYSADSLNPTYRAWGDYVLMLYNKDLPDSLSEYLRNHQSFVETYEPEEGLTMFVFALPESIKESYVKPVLAGKYSQADRKVVDLYFPKDPNHPRYGNRLVLDKSDLWRADWEKKIGISLPEEAEVWSKAQQKNETYGFIDPTELGLAEATDQLKVAH